MWVLRLQVLGARFQGKIKSLFLHSLTPSTYNLAPASRGFSLLELLVVTGIFMVLSTIVLSTNARFGSVIVLKNLAHDMALTIRQAQVYGIAVRRYQEGGGANFYVGYGMHFTLPGEGSPSTYELFADAIKNGVYDPGETIQSTTLAGGYRIVDICAREAATGIETCSVPEVHMVFRRPEPDALIRRAAGASLDDRVRIIIESNKGDQAEVVVESSGQISVH